MIKSREHEKAMLAKKMQAQHEAREKVRLAKVAKQTGRTVPRPVDPGQAKEDRLKRAAEETTKRMLARQAQLEAKGKNPSPASLRAKAEVEARIESKAQLLLEKKVEGLIPIAGQDWPIPEAPEVE